jgi:hypothetical protein
MINSLQLLGRQSQKPQDEVMVFHLPFVDERHCMRGMDECKVLHEVD